MHRVYRNQLLHFVVDQHRFDTNQPIKDIAGEWVIVHEFPHFLESFSCLFHLLLVGGGTCAALGGSFALFKHITHSLHLSFYNKLINKNDRRNFISDTLSGWVRDALHTSLRQFSDCYLIWLVLNEFRRRLTKLCTIDWNGALWQDKGILSNKFPYRLRRRRVK